MSAATSMPRDVDLEREERDAARWEEWEATQALGQLESDERTVRHVVFLVLVSDFQTARAELLQAEEDLAGALAHVVESRERMMQLSAAIFENWGEPR